MLKSCLRIMSQGRTPRTVNEGLVDDADETPRLLLAIPSSSAMQWLS